MLNLLAVVLVGCLSPDYYQCEALGKFQTYDEAVGWAEIHLEPKYQSHKILHFNHIEMSATELFELDVLI